MDLLDLFCVYREAFGGKGKVLQKQNNCKIARGTALGCEKSSDIIIFMLGKKLYPLSSDTMGKLDHLDQSQLTGPLHYSRSQGQVYVALGDEF